MNKKLITMHRAFVGVGMAVAALFCSDAAQGASPDYASMNYTWTDAANATHTSNVLDEATSIPQMKALITYVYANKALPGTKEVTYINSEWVWDGWNPGYQTVEKQQTVNYNGWQISSSNRPYNFDSSSYSNNSYYTPNDDAITALLVNLKDDFTEESLTTDFDTAWERIKSIKLIPHSVRVDGDANPGTIINLNEPVNKFFIMTKGNPGNSNWDSMVPFGHLFEQLSPSQTFSECQNVYSEMAAGKKYEVKHNCGSTIQLGHPTMVYAADNTEPRQINMLVYIPDRRFRLETSNFNNYADDYRPFFYLYTISLDTPVLTVPENTDEKASVDLTWTSSQKSITKDNNTEEFQVYRRVNGGEWTLVPASDITVTQSGTTQNGDNVERSQDATVKVTVAEPHDREDRIIEYRILGRVANSDFEWVQSNEQRVTIEGWAVNSDPKLVLSLTHHSFFDVDKQQNLYDNTVSLLIPDTKKMVRQNIGDPNHPVAEGREKVAVIDLLRFSEQPGQAPLKDYFNENGTDAEKVASITITRKAESDNNYFYYDAALTINGATTHSNLRSAKSANAEQEPLESVYEAERKAGILLSVVDHFPVSVREQADGNTYTYRWQSKSMVCLSPEIDSNIDNYKAVGAFVRPEWTTYTLSQVMADTDHALAPSRPAVEFNMFNEQRINYYDITLAKGDHHTIAKANRSPEIAGFTYLVEDETSESGALKSVPELAGQQLVTILGVPQKYEEKEVVLTTFCANNNSYGSPRVSLPKMPRVDVTYGRSHFNQDLQLYQIESKWNVDFTSEASSYNDHLVADFGVWRDHSLEYEDNTFNTLVYHKQSTAANALAREAASEFGKPVDFDNQNYRLYDQYAKDENVNHDPHSVWYQVRSYATLAKDPSRYVVTDGFGGWRFDPDNNGPVTGVDGFGADSENAVSVSLNGTELTICGEGVVNLFSLTGERLASLPATEQTVRTMSVSGLAKGTYIVTVGTKAVKVIL